MSPYVNTTFQYNDEGIRTVKIANGVRHEYTVSGGQINREVVYSSNGQYVTQDLRYYYDASGKPVAIRAFTRSSSTAAFTDATYYLLTNMQGDVVAIYNDSGVRIFEYVYDAWGNILRSTQVATGGSAANSVNPFRYRGYYYDAETGLYYLQSRYYNPAWGRFLNADRYVNANGDLIGFNMYAYCSNNPVMYSDPSGKGFRDWLKKLFGFNNSKPERDTQFTSDCYTPPETMNPYLDFGWDVISACDEDYQIIGYQVFEYNIDNPTAYAISDNTQRYYQISDILNSMVSAFQSSMLTYGYGWIGAVSWAVKCIDFLDSLQTNPNIYVASGTYTTVVALYGNDGNYWVTTRTYSDYLSDYNTPWVLEGYSIGTPLSEYAKIKPTLPKPQ